MPTDAEQRIIDGTVWHEFCDRLKASGDAILRDSTPGDAFTRAEGFRYLTRVLRAGLDGYLEHGDPRRPAFFQFSNELIKIGNDNPDNLYHNTTIDGRYDYRITGNRGTVPYLSMGTKRGGYQATGGMEPTGQVEFDQLEIAPDGSFELIMSAKEQKGNWLPMQPDSNMMIVRQTFQDRAKEVPATYEIECIGESPDTKLDVDSFERKMMAAVNFVSNTANIFVDWMDIYAKHINQLPSDDQERCQAAGGDRTIHYLQGYWKLAPDEALVIEAKKIPNCASWNFQLSDYWMESLDYANYKVHVNKHTAVYEDDGSVRIVVAHEDPGAGYPNWLTTQGHNEGGMLFRWIEADEHPPVETRVVKLSEL
jgi:hypothetical protein